MMLQANALYNFAGTPTWKVELLALYSTLKHKHLI